MCAEASMIVSNAQNLGPKHASDLRFYKEPPIGIEPMIYSLRPDPEN